MRRRAVGVTASIAAATERRAFTYDGDRVAPPRDEVDLAEPRAVADCEDPVALAAQGEGGEPFGAVAEPEAGLPTRPRHAEPLSSSARA